MRAWVNSLPLLLVLGCTAPSGRSGHVPPPAEVEPDSLAVAPRTPPPAVPPPASAATASRLAVLAPFSGAQAGNGRSYLDGVRYAVESAKGSAAVPIEIVPADDKGNPATALQAVRRLDEEEQVTCIVGGFPGTATWVAATEANCRGVPMLCNVLHDEELSRIGGYVFHEGVSQVRAARAAAELVMLELRLFRPGLLHQDSGDGAILASEFAARVTELGGRVVASEVFPAGTTDFTAAVRRLRAANPDAIYLPVDAPTMLLVAPALTYQGVEAQIVGVAAWNSSTFLQRVAPDLEGALIPAGEVGGADMTGLVQFEAAYRSRHGRAPSRYATAGYLAGRRVLEALGTGNAREALRAELAARAAARGGEAAFRFLLIQDDTLVPFSTP